jgi:hypothetical protein
MIRLATQFDPPGTHAAEAAIPGGCCSCCCCCCCLATTVSVSAVAAIQASHRASESQQRPPRADLWVGLAGGSLVAAALLAGAIAWVIAQITSDSSLAVGMFALGTVVLWGALLWAAFRGVGFGNPVMPAVGFVLVGILAFAVEALIGAFLVLLFFPVYLILAAVVIGIALWMATGPHGPPSSTGGSAQQ